MVFCQFRVQAQCTGVILACNRQCLSVLSVPQRRCLRENILVTLLVLLMLIAAVDRIIKAGQLERDSLLM